MPTAADPAGALLIELTRRGVELQAHGDRLRYRPWTALTPGLAERVKVHKPALLVILAEREANGSAPRYSAGERRLMRNTPPELWTTVNAVKRHFPGAEVVAVHSPRRHLAGLLRGARQRGDHDHASTLREAWRERAAVMEFEGCIPRYRAEAAALEETLVRIEKAGWDR